MAVYETIDDIARALTEFTGAERIEGLDDTGSFKATLLDAVTGALKVIVTNLPTSDPSDGFLWNDAGVLTVSSPGGGGGLGPYDLTLNGEPLTLNGEQLRMTPNLMLLGGEPLLFNGEYLTLGN